MFLSGICFLLVEGSSVPGDGGAGQGVGFAADAAAVGHHAFLRGGVALTYFKNEKQSTQGYGSASVGFTLASGRTFASYLSVGYSYIGRDRCMQRGTEHDCRGMSYATMRIGISF